MGRGRSKAKQTKVARDLKYSNQDMDLERLAKELHGELDSNNKNSDDENYGDENYSKG
jgi:hypothetical protein